MSLQHRSSTERLTPEYRPPDREASPLDFPLDDVLPYDSFDDESFVVDSPSDRSSHTAGSSPGFLSDTPDYDLIAAVNRSMADHELDLLMIQGEHAFQMQNREIRDNMAAQHREALLLCRRAADLEHRLEVLSVQVRQLNQEPPRNPTADGENGEPSSSNRTGRSNNSSLLVGGERVPLPPSDLDLALLAHDDRLAQKIRRRLETMDVRIGQIDMGLITSQGGPSYILNAVDRRHSTDRNINQAIDRLLDGRDPDQFFQEEAEIDRAMGFGRDGSQTLEHLTDDLFVRVAEVVRLESGLEREIFSRLRAAEQSVRDQTYDGGLRGAESLFGNGRAELRARDKVNWLYRQKHNLRRLQLDSRTNPDLNPQPLRGAFWPPYAYPVDPSAPMPTAPHTRPQFLFRLRAHVHGNLDEVPPLDRDPAVSLLQARYRLWQTRRAAETLSAAASHRQRRPPQPDWEIDDSDYDDLFDSSPVREVAPPPLFQTRSIRNTRDQLVNVELGRPQERRLPPTLPTQRGPPQVIDLTDLAEEPDSPVIVTGSHSLRPSLRNLRRHTSQSNPPPLARSDSSILGSGSGAQEVIDLTEDDPEPQPAWRRRRHYPGFPELPNLGARPRTRNAVHQQHAVHQRQMFDRFREAGALFPSFFGLLDPSNPGRSIQAAFDPIGRVNLQYGMNNAFERPVSPKPAPEVPKPARPGFTRDTDPDTMFVCPGCNEELAYDPDETPGAPAPSRSKAKRSRSEHHFWALKSCGHVYCSDCFENRKPAAKRPKIFPTAQGNTVPTCCVEDCDTPILPKGNWVGIYM